MWGNLVKWLRNTVKGFLHWALFWSSLGKLSMGQSSNISLFNKWDPHAKRGWSQEIVSLLHKIPFPFMVFLFFSLWIIKQMGRPRKKSSLSDSTLLYGKQSVALLVKVALILPRFMCYFVPNCMVLSFFFFPLNPIFLTWAYCF